MKNEKGILGRLLSVVGAIIVITGVFVFQGFTHADETEGEGAGDGGAIVSVPGAENGSSDSGSSEGSEGSPESGAEGAGGADGAGETQTTPAHNFAIKYYKEITVDVEDEETGETVQKTELQLLDTQAYAGDETEYTFTIPETVPEGEGDFLAWQDKENEKYYTVNDEITLNAENPELNLIAKFAVLRSYALKYSANGGRGAPNAQACESYLLTCDFTISNVTPSKEGYEFKGWVREGNDSIVYAPGAMIRSESSDEPLVLYAVWAEIRTYTLMYDVNGGSGTPVAQSCKSADGTCRFIISDVVPSRNGFGFLGWQRGGETYAANAEIIVSETNTVLIANWNPIYNFTLTYETEGKDVQDMPEAQKCETVEGSCTFIVPEKEPVREGYKFKGWRFEDQPEMLAKAGDELVVAIDGPLDLKIHAVWSRVYTILNSGEVFGAGERVVLRSAAEYGNFKHVSIDSQDVPEDYYSLGEGTMTSIVLGNAFAQSLSSGEHAFEITWSDGEAAGIISVNQNEDGTKRFVVMDGSGSSEGITLMSRPKAGAVSKESSGVVADAATGNEESNFDAVRTLILVAVAAFVVVYIVNRFYVRHKMDFIENF